MACRKTSEEMLKTIDDAIAKKKMIADGYPVSPFTTKENMEVYDSVYSLCTQKKPLMDYASLLYDKYINCLEERIEKKVIPMLVGKHGTALLTEVARLWSEYAAFTKSLSKLFLHLEWRYVGQNGLPSLIEALPQQEFSNLVLDDMLYRKLQEATMCLIIEEREGKQIDRDLLKTVLNLLVEVGGKGKINYYEKFEQAMLAEAAAYYSQLSLEWWFWRDSFSNYLRKVDWCLIQEEGRAEVYPCQTTKAKLLEVMKYVLLDRNVKKWAQAPKAGELAAEDRELLSNYTQLSIDEGSSAATVSVLQD